MDYTKLLLPMLGSRPYIWKPPTSLVFTCPAWGRSWTTCSSIALCKDVWGGSIWWHTGSTVEPLLWAATLLSSRPRMRGHLVISQKWHFVYKWTSYEQPPVLKGHFSCVARVAAHSRFYCISMLFQCWSIIQFIGPALSQFNCDVEPPLIDNSPANTKRSPNAASMLARPLRHHWVNVSCLLGDEERPEALQPSKHDTLTQCWTNVGPAS